MDKLTAEQMEYLRTREFELWYYLPDQTPENSEDEEKGNCTFWIKGDEIYFGSGLFSRKLNEVTDSYLDLADEVIDDIDSKEPNEVLCLNFMYNVLLRLGEYLYDLCEAAECECQSFYYIIREESTFEIEYEGDIVWDLSDFM